MINQQLLDYIKQQLAQGVSKEIINTNLLSQGWQQQDVNEAFSMVENKNANIASSEVPVSEKRKQSKDWYIAATHWLTAGLAMPFLLTFILGIPATMIIGKDNVTQLTVVMSAIWIFSLWPGVMYSAKYLAKTYVIKNSDNVVKSATIYLGVLGGGFRLIKLSEGISAASMIDLGLFIVGVAVFYILSKKYVKNNDDLVIKQ